MSKPLLDEFSELTRALAASRGRVAAVTKKLELHIAGKNHKKLLAMQTELKQLREFVAGIASTACDYETTREHFANDPCRGRCDSCIARELLKGLNE